MKNKSLLLFFAMLFIFSSGFGQTLYFNSGEISLNPEKNSVNNLSSAYFDGRYYLLVRTAEPGFPQEWLSKGVLQGDYIPDQAYFCQVPAELMENFLQDSRFLNVVAVETNWKIQKEFSTNQPPYWSDLGNGIWEAHLLLFSEIGSLEETQAYFSGSLLSVQKTPYPKVYKVQFLAANMLQIAALPVVQFMGPADAPAEPENYRGVTDHRSNYISTEYQGGPQYNGTGITIMMNDDGFIGPHIDYQGRTDQTNVGPSAGGHGDHVAGIIMGAGNKDPRNRGMAWGAKLMVWDYPDGMYTFPASYTNDSVMITSSSYSDGCNAGYTSFSQLVDQTTRTHRSLVHVFSSGNNGTSDCSYGAGAGWANITGGQKAGKNCITVGNVTKEDVIAGSSSRGPVHDGRLKPEVVAVGSSVLSTTDPNDYVSLSGTSMACPGVSGTLGQLYQVYKDNNGGQYPPSALIKAHLMNTADDLGNAGPDFIYGYGRINARRAAATILNNQTVIDTITTGANQAFTVTVPAGMAELRVLLYWHDPAASPSTSVALINNLALTVTDPASQSYNPWILDFTANAVNLNTPAVRGIDVRNNHEQVTLANPAAGTYTVNVQGVAVNQGGSQEYFVVYEMVPAAVTLTYPIGGEGFTPGEQVRTRWDYYGTPGTFALAYSTNGGSSWTNINTNISSGTRYYDWTVPNIVNGDMRVRITRGASNDASHTDFSIINVPTNITLDTICGSRYTLKWSAVSGATGYEVFKLGQKFMELQGTTTNLWFTMNNVNPNQDNWFSVKALGANGAKSRRAVAVQAPTGPLNCVLLTELEANQVIQPDFLNLPSCLASATQTLRVALKNNGQNAVSNINLNYSLNGSAGTPELFAGPIAPGATSNYTFTQTLNLQVPGIYTLKVWATVNNDQNLFNDTITRVINIVNSVPAPLPFSDNFETFTLCSTSSNCGTTVCNLGNSWINLQNGVEDDIDWRTSEGSTVSANTGPDVDYNPGTATGNYLYLEASSCFNNEAHLISPCIDLTGVGAANLSYAYHMFGSNIGTLHVDVFSNGAWVNDVVPAVSGNQGNVWQTQAYDLAPYLGQVILLRFRGNTGADYMADMALDAIQINTLLADFNYQFTGNSVCLNQPVTFTNNSVGNINQYSWSFGANANPPTATGAGPHIVTFTSGTNASVLLTVNGPNGSDQQTTTFALGDVPNVSFNASTNGLQLNLVNNTTGATTYAWDFGDGNTSAFAFPSYSYASGGTYTVTLIATNDCGSDTLTQQVTTAGFGIEDEETGVSIYPVPASSFVTIESAQLIEEIRLYDAAGRLLETLTGPKQYTYTMNISDRSSGVYFVQINAAKKSYKLIIK